MSDWSSDVCSPDLILPEIAGTAVLASLLQLDLPEAADPVLRLGALLEPGAEQARRVARRLRLSKAETAELVMLGEPEAVLGDAAAVLTLGRDEHTGRHALSIALYRHGRTAFRTARSEKHKQETPSQKR